MLDQCSTVVDLLPRLADPADWLAGLLGNFVSHGYDPEASVIRHGLTGDGIVPNYIIQEPGRSVILQIGLMQVQLTQYPHRTFSGRNHRELIELDDLEWRDDHWSAETITFAETKALLARLSKHHGIH